VATADEPFRSLVGEQLAAVDFAEEYVALRFIGPEGPPLYARNPPSVRIGEKVHSWGEAGYRDALCERISTRLENGFVTESEIVLELDDGATLTISRHDDTGGVAPEVAELFAPDQTWVWRAGE
jgi:hypothetical protein